MNSRYIFKTTLVFFFLLGSKLYSQEVILNYINTDSLFNFIVGSQKAAVIQYWVPSCPSSELQLVEYSRLVDKYGESVDFYFIGLTKSIKYLDGAKKHHNLHSSIYLIDTLTLGEDLFEKKENFNFQIMKLLGTKRQKDFITAYIDEKTKKYSNGLKIDEKRINKMLKNGN